MFICMLLLDNMKYSRLPTATFPVYTFDGRLLTLHVFFARVVQEMLKKKEILSVFFYSLNNNIFNIKLQQLQQ